MLDLHSNAMAFTPLAIAKATKICKAFAREHTNFVSPFAYLQSNMMECYQKKVLLHSICEADSAINDLNANWMNYAIVHASLIPSIHFYMLCKTNDLTLLELSEAF